MKKFIFFWISVSLYHPSLIFAMRRNIEMTPEASYRVKFAGGTVTDTEFSEIFQRSNFNSIKKLEISNSRIDPEFIRRLPAGLKELSLSFVTGLQGNKLLVHQFLQDALYFDELEVLSLRN